MESSPPRRSRARTSAIAVRSEGYPDSPPTRHPRPSRVPGSNRERSVPPPPKSRGTPKTPPARVRQSTYAAPSAKLQVLVDPPPTNDTLTADPPQLPKTPTTTPKKVKRRATAQGSIGARKSLPAPDALTSPKLSGIARPVSDASAATKSIARPVRTARASLPLIQVHGQAESGREGVVSPPPRLPPVTRLPPIPTSPPIPLSPPFGASLDFLRFNSGRESVTAIASTLQIPISPPLPAPISIDLQDPASVVAEEAEEPAGEGPTMTSDEVLSKIDAQIAFGNEAMEKINERIARIYEMKVDWRRQVRMSRTL
ncbi:unnamed protein product [Peniophora sp. CBMAI 1063]|nr:unnamed protein product [Peniophora sp. CBMAI 1063]